MLQGTLFAQLTAETALVGVVSAALTGAFTAVAYLQRKNSKLEKREAWYRNRIADLDNQVVNLNVYIEQLRTSGDNGLKAEIVVDALTGTIREWSPGATQMLHWTQRDALGKPLTLIIPQRFREPHLDKMRALIKSGEPPVRGPHDLLALMKDGSELPVSAIYSGWKDGSEHFVSAVLTRRSIYNHISPWRNPHPSQKPKAEGDEDGQDSSGD